jgi:uncharacterized membrane protein
MRAETAYALLVTFVIVGFAFALYATFETYDTAAQQTCSPTPYISCAKIDSSGQTSTLGIPDWSFGVAGYVALLILGLATYRTWDRNYLLAFAIVSGLGALLSLYLGYIELAVNQGICPICLGAYLSNAAALITALYLLRLSRSGPDDAKPAPTGADADRA